MNLLQTATGGRMPAEVVQMEPQEIDEFGQRFEFDWQALTGCEIYALRLNRERLVVGMMALKNIPDELRIEIVLLESSRENVGRLKTYERIAGCLIGFACRLAFMRGYFGFVSLIPKTRLIEHYTAMYGFEQYGRHLAIDMERSQQLIEKYLSDER